MSKYVDADYINDFFDKWEEEVRNPEPLTFSIVQNVRSVLNEAPTIDIVWCKDCKWRDEIGCALSIVDDSDKPNDDDHCSYGERIEE